ncbi:MAG: GNAT family N-acetyltransferase [bacterium]
MPSKKNIFLRDLLPDDISAVADWPSYPPCFGELDYALRDRGWLPEYFNKPDTKCYAAEYSDELIGFAILSKTSETEAEFRIALKPDKTGKGFGKIITTMVLEDGFLNMNINRIHLIVRKNNPRAIRLYKNTGFAERGECIKEIEGKEAAFLVMDIYYKQYFQKSEEKL